MDELVVVTHPEPIRLEARQIEHESVPEGEIALAYYHEGRLLARGVVTPEAVKAISGILTDPVSVALAATEDKEGNIDARFCLVLPVDPEKWQAEEEEGPDEPWRTSVPAAPSFESGFESTGEDDEDEDERPRVALLPIGNVVRYAGDRHHPDNIARDLREMLVNLMEGKASDAVEKAIDDLLRSL
ncbi:MAG TPA: hypothetical protein VFO52_08305 [Longimicrobiales bacterium]|nr:hypothetical protein [Longimicrobiales bacterium]